MIFNVLYILYLKLSYILTQMLYESYVILAFIVVAIGSLCFGVPREGMPKRFMLRLFYWFYGHVDEADHLDVIGCCIENHSTIWEPNPDLFAMTKTATARKKTVLVHAGQCKQANCELLKMKRGARMVDTKKHKVMRSGESLPKTCLWLGPPVRITYLYLYDHCR